MMMKPNRTVIKGVVRAVRAAAGGLGHEVDLEVGENLSEKSGEDFIQPAKSDVLRLFAAEAPQTKEGDEVVVHARLMGGPGLERVVIESIGPGHS